MIQSSHSVSNLEYEAIEQSSLKKGTAVKDRMMTLKSKQKKKESMAMAMEEEES